MCAGHREGGADSCQVRNRHSSLNPTNVHKQRISKHQFHTSVAPSKTEITLDFGEMDQMHSMYLIHFTFKLFKMELFPFNKFCEKEIKSPASEWNIHIFITIIPILILCINCSYGKTFDALCSFVLTNLG